MTAKNLDQNTFPLYAIYAINHNYFVCAGGGGAAKTGVKNAIVSLKNEVEKTLSIRFFLSCCPVLESCNFKL